MLLLISCSSEKTQFNEKIEVKNITEENKFQTEKNNTDLGKALFAGGCFWCTEADMEKQEGVVEAISGYAGGETKNPSYKEVSSGKTEHIESVKVIYNKSQISYNELLSAYWKHIDPTDNKGQFVDRGLQYRPVIFYYNQEQKNKAEKSKKYIENKQIFNESIKVEIKNYTSFYKAEEYHQNYHKKSKIKYDYYRYNSGRDQFIEKHWKSIELNFSKDIMKSSKNNTKSKNNSKDNYGFDGKEELSEMEYYVAVENGTEPAFNNEYWNNTRSGIYVDIKSGTPLFSSTHKYKSGTGWPSFTKPINKSKIVLQPDPGILGTRTEVRTNKSNIHLGHVFDDGPEPTGKRYCMNSAALKFIPKEKMKEKGYNEYMYLFNKT